VIFKVPIPEGLNIYSEDGFYDMFRTPEEFNIKCARLNLSTENVINRKNELPLKLKLPGDK
jgi:hypothetical protein